MLASIEKTTVFPKNPSQVNVSYVWCMATECQPLKLHTGNEGVVHNITGTKHIARSNGLSGSRFLDRSIGKSDQLSSECSSRGHGQCHSENWTGVLSMRRLLFVGWLMRTAASICNLSGNLCSGIIVTYYERNPT